jgi:RND family efflux transporter MFP subunit
MSNPPAFLLLLLAASLVCGSCRRSDPPPEASGEDRVVLGPLVVWTACEGSLEARRVETILSRFQGRATLVELIPEGTAVKPGDLLARLDTSQLDNDLVKLRNGLSRAEAALDALAHADIPLEKQDLSLQLKELQYQYDTESRILTDTRELADRKLVPRHEIDQQEARLVTLAARRDQLEQRRNLVDRYVHPAKLTQAQADVDAARQQVNQAVQQLSNCVFTAPSAGLAVYLPLHLGNEFRTVRVGDTLYPNQPFLCIPDMGEFMVQSFIPETELARVQPGQAALVTPLAYPGLRLKATVESLGAMAQSRPGYPSWQKFFRLVIRLDERDERLRPGMSLQIDISVADRHDVTLIPRPAVGWENGAPLCRVRTARGVERRPLKLGQGNERWFEVLDGVRPGDQVVQP